MSYMLTVVFVAAMLGSDVSVPVLLAKQVAIGLAFGPMRRRSCAG